ncbi:MAG TPA: hypothetical protein VH062_31615 [Polyangiaceae bacterium]|jgi:hypothetical protein|nr:hypothetical protein [Polyangiaceae bacterium]
MIRHAIFAFVLAGCNVPLPKGSRGADLPDAVAPASDGSTAATCARAVVVAESDYMSTNVALLGLDGKVLSESVASSATSAVGLAAPLGGDVTVPTMPVDGDEVVLVDRDQSSDSIVWVDPTAPGKRKLSVATGFSSDPHDYVLLGEHKAYVSRYLSNPTPGKMPFDSGDDVLVVDPTVPSIVASIDMTGALGDDGATAVPSADSMVVAGDRVYVLLGARPRVGSDSNVPSRLVTIDTTKDEIVGTTVLDGFLGCDGVALAPDATRLAIFCSGKTIGQYGPSDLSTSGVTLVDLSNVARVVKRFGAADLGMGPDGFSGAFSSTSSLVLVTFGYNDAVTYKSVLDDTVVRLDVESGASSVVLRSDGIAFTLGGIVCDVACGACFIADAQRNGGVVHRFALDDAGTLSGDQPIKVETNPGLPPRYLGLLK